MTIKNARRAKITHLLQIPPFKQQCLQLPSQRPKHVRVVVKFYLAIASHIAFLQVFYMVGFGCRVQQLLRILIRHIKAPRHS